MAKKIVPCARCGKPATLNANYRWTPTCSTECFFWIRVKKTDGGCWEWSGNRLINSYGTLIVNGRQVRAHRFSYQLAYGETHGLHVLHKCDNPPCVNPDHLFLGTDADNVHDCIAKGRNKLPDPSTAPKGEANGHAKLTATQVQEIRVRYAGGGISLAALGQEYGVIHSNIHAIVSRRSWRHVE